MNKDEVKRLILQTILGNKVGVSVYMSPTKLATNAIINNWREEIKPPSNAPLDTLWFAYIDHMPSANFEHPVEYVFIDDKTGQHMTVRGTSPPDNINALEKIR